MEKVYNQSMSLLIAGFFFESILTLALDSKVKKNSTFDMLFGSVHSWMQYEVWKPTGQDQTVYIFTCNIWTS